MNSQTPASKEETPEIPATGVGGIADQMVKGDPDPADRLEGVEKADKELQEKIVKNSDEEKKDQGDSEAKDDSFKSENEGYIPAKEFMDFLNKETSSGESDSSTPDQEKVADTKANDNDSSYDLLQQIMRDNKELAPVIKNALKDKGINLDTPGDPETLRQIEGIKGDIENLAQMINSDRDAIIGQSTFESINEIYLDVVKEVPTELRGIVDRFNNTELSNMKDMGDLTRKDMELANKAITSELDNAFESWAKTKGYTKQSNLPPTFTKPGELTPPNKEEKNKPVNDSRPINAFADVDADFERKVQNLLNN